MLKDSEIKIVAGVWDDLAKLAKTIRVDVFIQEQNIAAEEEWDEQDAISIHFVVYEKGHAIATARLLANNSIGRVAVLKSHRGLKIGQQLMQAIIDYAKADHRKDLKLSSQ